MTIYHSTTALIFCKWFQKNYNTGYDSHYNTIGGMETTNIK